LNIHIATKYNWAASEKRDILARLGASPSTLINPCNNNNRARALPRSPRPMYIGV